MAIKEGRERRKIQEKKIKKGQKDERTNDRPGGMTQ